MNLEPDVRSDLYSLGITFYWLLTGELPFQAADPLEWVYSHVTQVAAPPQRLNRAVPDLLGDLLLKLMAKNPADRYQSARGLHRDLLEAQRQWQATGHITPFPLARAEVNTQFQLHPRLYGRAEEVQALHDAYQTAAEGKTVLVTLAGLAGSGKSSLVHEAMRKAGESGGFYLAGKFDQYQRQAPYAAVSQALVRLVRQLLAEPEDRLAYWKTELLMALGQNGRIALELVPELVHVIGPQPAMEALNPTEEQNRFLSTINLLIATLARPEHPVVLFLDDLQWSDTPTLLLLRSLFETHADKALLLIAAFRHDELPEGQPYPVGLGDIWNAPGVRHLQIEPLDEDTINRMVADALDTDPERTQSLGAYLYGRTEGIPFFAKELLRTLHQDGLLSFDHQTASWTWELEDLHRARIREDVVGFMLGRIRRLDPETQALLSLAACIGSTFDLRLLTQALDQSPEDVLDALWPALLAGLVVPLSEDDLRPRSGQDRGSIPLDTRCEFLHDRVRQAAYALLPEDERQRTHLRLGRLMLEKADEEALATQAPDIALQLNAGRELIMEETDRLELARINLLAARKAKEAAAYRPAFGFAEVAREILPAQAWTEHYALALDLYKLAATCAYLCGEFEVAEQGCTELRRHCRTRLEQAEVHAMTSSLYSYSNRMDEAIEEGLRALALLGIKLTAKPGLGTVALELMRTRAVQGRRKARDFEAAPLVSDPTIRLSMKILADFMAPAYLTGNETLFATTMLRLARLSLQHGNCVEAVTAYSCYSVLLAGLGDLRGAYDFGQLALRLTERFGAYHTKSRTLVLYALFAHSWSKPWSGLDDWFKESVEVGRQSGDFLFMAFACGYVHLWAPQVDLGTAVAAGEHYLSICRQTHYQNAVHAASCAHQLWRSLRGETAAPLSLSDSRFDAARCLEQMQQTRYVSGIAIYHVCKLQLACLHEEWDEAWNELLAAERVIKALAGSPYLVDYTVHGFQLAARMAARGGSKAWAARRLLRSFHRRMRAWAKHCPENFRLHACLMEAELAWMKGRIAAAPALFDVAIQAAQGSGFVRYEALANEAAARFYRSRGWDKAARAYQQDARDAYARWGALAKVRSLDRLLAGRTVGGSTPETLPSAQPMQPVNLGLVPQLVEHGVLDLATVWKATQAISGEVILKRLLERLLAIVKENAGAQKGILVLRDGDEGASSFAIQAESLEDGEVRLLHAEPLEGSPELPVSLIRYVIRSQAIALLGDAARQGGYTRDPYILTRQPRSILALPIVNQGSLLGVLYLENNLLTDAFPPERLAVLQILAAQAGISLQNALSAERAAYLEAAQTLREAQARDLEERVAERTAELKQAYDQLKEVDQLKTNFLSLVSHELRTPLTTILGYAEFLEDRVDGDLSAGQEESVRQIQQATMRLRRLVDDLLDFARIEAGTFNLVRSQVDVAEKIKETVESLRPLIQETQLTLRLQLPDEPAAIWADAGRLTQVLLNLLGNAIKFTPTGGEIAVSLQVSEVEMRVEVTDSGIGIDAEHLPKLFQKFYQVDSSSTRSRGGAGLGLSIAQSIVEAHGGKIGVRSVTGQGSIFWFTLPLRAQTRVAPSLV
ncbi:MAG TPA: AAA family ATPase, partial [Stenomitos sp.]